MRTTRRMAVLALAGTLLGPAAALAEAGGGKLAVERAWARATAPGAGVGAVYLVIDNRGKRSDRLLRVSTPRARSAEVHATIRELDQVRMRRVDPLHVGAGERLELKPGGTHVMLFGLAQPLRAGERFPLSLLFERAGEVTVQVSVTAAAAGAADPHAGHRH